MKAEGQEESEIFIEFFILALSPSHKKEGMNVKSVESHVLDTYEQYYQSNEHYA